MLRHIHVHVIYQCGFTFDRQRTVVDISKVALPLLCTPSCLIVRIDIFLNAAVGETEQSGRIGVYVGGRTSQIALINCVAPSFLWDQLRDCGMTKP